MRRVILAGTCLLVWLIVVPALTGCASSGPAASQVGPPQAQFAANVKEGAAPLKVDFGNTSQNADEFQWDFGDAGTATTSRVDEPVSHEYSKAGTHTVTLTAGQKGQPQKTVTMTLTITVRPGPPAKVKISPETARLDIGQSQRFSASASDAYGNSIPEAQFTWETSDGAGTIADGAFTAGTKAGVFSKAVVATAKVGTQSANAAVPVSINPDPLKKVTVPATEVVAGQTRQLEAVASDQYGNRITGLEEVWSVLNENLGATTKAGLLTAGEVARTFSNSVEVQIKQAGSTQNARGSVTITSGPMEQVVVAPNTVRIGIGMTQQFVAVGADRYGNRVAGLKFKWSADKGGIIDDSGLFTGGSAPGTYKGSVKVEATQAEKTVSALATVTVEPDRIVFISNRSDNQTDMYIMDTSGGNVERLTTTRTYEYWPSVSPDGRRILFESFASSDGILVMNDDGSWLRQLMANSPTVAYLDPTWSPDGSKIAFTKANLELSGRFKDVGLFVMDADGGNVKELFYSSGGTARYPAWSPDGRQIAFYSDRWQFGVPVVNADGSNARQLTSMQGTCANPVWSPDGKKIAFQSYKPGQGGVLQYEIFVMNADGSNVNQLTNNKADDSEPCWSADGKKILFASKRDTKDKSQIYVMDADGSNVKRLTENEANETRPRWMPRKSGVKVTEASVVIPASSTPKKAMSTQELTAKARKAVVRIKTDLGSGSGFIVDPNGVILTNNHVLVDAKEITAYIDDGTKYTASVKWRDPVRDLALIEISAGSLPFLELGDLSQISLGQQVVVLGYPLKSESVSVTSGLVSTIKPDSGSNIMWVQTDSAINPGNSGGPLFDLYGQVIGVITLKRFGAEGIGYAISANTVKTYLPQLGQFRE